MMDFSMKKENKTFDFLEEAKNVLHWLVLGLHRLYSVIYLNDDYSVQVILHSLYESKVKCRVKSNLFIPD